MEGFSFGCSFAFLFFANQKGGVPHKKREALIKPSKKYGRGRYAFWFGSCYPEVGMGIAKVPRRREWKVDEDYDGTKALRTPVFSRKG